MEPIWERKFIHASFACRVGKGVHSALRHLQTQVRQISRGGRSAVWVLQLDLARFFVTIHRPTLCTLMLQHAPFPEIARLIQVIYSADGRVGAKIMNPARHHALIPRDRSWFGQPSDRGLPIGNLTSQFGANVYLTALDHFIQRTLKPAAYLRYMDDLLLIDRTPDRMVEWAATIDPWLATHRLQALNPAKTVLTRLDRGITYLGCKAAQTGFRNEPLQLFPTGKKKWKLVQSLRQLTDLDPLPMRPHPLSLRLPDPEALHKIASTNSLLGTLVHTQSYGFRKKALLRLERESAGLDLPPELHPDPWPPLLIKKGYRALRLR